MRREEYEAKAKALTAYLVGLGLDDWEEDERLALFSDCDSRATRILARKRNGISLVPPLQSSPPATNLPAESPYRLPQPPRPRRRILG